MYFSRLTILSGLLAAARAAPSSLQGAHSRATSACADVSGTFEIENYKLYSENLDWDPVHCKLYIR